MICPRCRHAGKKNFRQCPKRDGEPVCTDCCYYSCKHWNENVGRCMWHSQNPRIDYNAELSKLEYAITRKKKSIEYFYKTNKPKVAERIEFELTDLNIKKRRLIDAKSIQENKRTP